MKKFFINLLTTWTLYGIMKIGGPIIYKLMERAAEEIGEAVGKRFADEYIKKDGAGRTSRRPAMEDSKEDGKEEKAL